MNVNKDLRSASRRNFMRTVGLGGLGGLGGAALALSSKAGISQTVAGRRPNILLILTDDQGWGDIGSHGNDVISTPVMDGLAASGARFDRFYVSPVCAPTRAAVLTGRYPYRTGVSGVTRARETMRLNEVTIAQVLKEEGGYRTGCFGKWHNGAHFPYHPNGKGFDEFFGFCAGHWNNYFDTSLDRNGEPERTEGYITDVLTDAALKFIEENSAEPFFCYLPYNAPHSPFQVPDNYFDKYQKLGCDDKLSSVYGMCENLDDNIGRLLSKLEELGLTRDTIVVFLTDNGPNTDRDNGGMRSRKGGVHEGGVRVPCFISWPGHIEPGITMGSIAAHIDLLPTLTELAGVRDYETLPLDGRSFAPPLLGEAESQPERMLFTGWGGRGAVRTQRYRLVVERNGEAELYDMTTDPGENNDIAGKSPETTGKLKTAYDAWYGEVTRDGFETPPIPVGYRESPLVELPAHEGVISGMAHYVVRAGWANDWVTGWTDTESSVHWDIDIVREGSYEITLMYVCPAEDIGSRVRVEVGGGNVEGKIVKAHDPKTLPSPDRSRRIEVYEKVWAPRTLGVLELRPGKTRLTVKALSKPGRTVMELKSVRIKRIG